MDSIVLYIAIQQYHPDVTPDTSSTGVDIYKVSFLQKFPVKID